MSVLHVLLSEAWGGLEIYSLDLIVRLKNKEAVLLCKKNSKLDIEAKAKGITVTYSKTALWKNWNIIHVHRRQDLPICRFSLIFRSEIKFVYSLLMNAPPKQDLYHRWIYSRINALMSSSELLNNDVKKNFPIDSNRVHLVRYGRDFSNQRLSTQDQILLIESMGFQSRLDKNSNSKKIIFGTLCRIDPGKGVGEIAEALNFLSEQDLEKIEMWLIGDPTLLRLGPQGEEIFEEASRQLYDKIKAQAQLDKFKNTLRLIPFKKNPWPYLSCMDVFILASYQETYSLAVLDAMSLGSPVIGTQSGGTIEQIGENQERGHFSKARDPKSIANSIQYYLNNLDQIQSQGQRAQAWCLSEHGWDKCIDHVEKIYQSC